jgi:hypothetical protein
MLSEIGYFGNIYVRQNRLAAGQTFGGHKHHFDHVTLLAQGKVKISMDGMEPKEFSAPTFIVIRAESRHKITALEDDTLYYCIFALRNIDGEVIDGIYGPEHDPHPLAHATVADAKDAYLRNKPKIENI